MAYTNKYKVAELLGVEESDIKDDWLLWADAEVEARTGKVFREIAFEKKYDGSGNDELILDVFPIVSISKVEYLTQYTPTEIWKTLDPAVYRLYAEEGILKLVPATIVDWDVTEFDEGVQNWKVTGKYGMSSTVAVPKLVEFLATLFAAQQYQIHSTGASGSIVSERIGEYSVNYDVAETSGEAKVSDVIEAVVKQIRGTEQFGVKVV